MRCECSSVPDRSLFPLDKHPPAPGSPRCVQLVAELLWPSPRAGSVPRALVLRPAWGAEWSRWVDGRNAFCMPAVLILATGMSINSPGSGLQALQCPSRVLDASQPSALPSGFGAQRRRGEEHLFRKPRVMFVTQLFASFLSSLAPARLTAQLCQGTALGMPHEVLSPPPRQV